MNPIFFLSSKNFLLKSDQEDFMRWGYLKFQYTIPLIRTTLFIFSPTLFLVGVSGNAADTAMHKLLFIEKSFKFLQEYINNLILEIENSWQKKMNKSRNFVIAPFHFQKRPWSLVFWYVKQGSDYSTNFIKINLNSITK